MNSSHNCDIIYKCDDYKVVSLKIQSHSSPRSIRSGAIRRDRKWRALEADSRAGPNPGESVFLLAVIGEYRGAPLIEYPLANLPSYQFITELVDLSKTLNSATN